jgi:hypothetical protein
MRSRLIALSVVVLFGALVGGPALAQSDEGSTFPDLPGMRLADRASKGQVAEFSPGDSEPTAGTASTSSSSPGSGGTSRTSEATRANGADEPDASPILELPATSGLPLIGEVKVGLAAVRRGVDSMPRGLAALAAFGTLLSVGGFLLLRDRLVG